jgi:hypothetical protein
MGKMLQDYQRAMRLRDNKRRNRQKQKDYTASLAARLHELQDKGVQATKEVQQSARRVVEDNSRLKALLRHVGVNDYMIETWTPDAIQQPPREVPSGEKQQRAARGGQMVGCTFAETVLVTDSNRIARLMCIVRRSEPLLNWTLLPQRTGYPLKALVNTKAIVRRSRSHHLAKASQRQQCLYRRVRSSPGWLKIQAQISPKAPALAVLLTSKMTAESNVQQRTLC